MSFIIGEKIKCTNLDGLDLKRCDVLREEKIPEIGKEYSVRFVHDGRSIHLVEIVNNKREYQNGFGECLFPIRWFQSEPKTSYRVVEVEIDKRVKEKRKELIFSS